MNSAPPCCSRLVAEQQGGVFIRGSFGAHFGGLPPVRRMLGRTHFFDSLLCWAQGQVGRLFSQVGAIETGQAGGLGIGLALVQGLVEMQGGSVSCTSEGPGQGSTFTVELLLAEVPVAIVAVKDPLADARRQRRRIPVVDDSRDGAKA